MAKWIGRILISCSLMMLMVSVISAQGSELISADNVGRLQPVGVINYADYDADINIGWFIVNGDATEFVIFDNNKSLYRLSAEGEILEEWQYVSNDEQLFSVIDGAYLEDTSYILYTIDNQFWINDTPFTLDGVPFAMGSDSEFLYVESQIDSQLVIYQLNSDLMIIDQTDIISDTSQPVIRIGRIGLPMILQTTFDGQVTLFDFDTELGVYQAGEFPTVFGHLNYDRTHFAWSDPNSTYLNLLDLGSGDNKLVTALNNLYSQYYLLSHDASLVMAVNVDFEPIIVGWDTNTGESFELGEYRDCERIPDRVKLSDDGATLIIGCDLGLELWRIVDTEDEN